MLLNSIIFVFPIQFVIYFKFSPINNNEKHTTIKCNLTLKYNPTAQRRKAPTCLHPKSNVDLACGLPAVYRVHSS